MARAQEDSPGRRPSTLPSRSVGAGTAETQRAKRHHDHFNYSPPLTLASTGLFVAVRPTTASHPLSLIAAFLFQYFIVTPSTGHGRRRRPIAGVTMKYWNRNAAISDSGSLAVVGRTATKSPVLASQRPAARGPCSRRRSTAAHGCPSGCRAGGTTPERQWRCCVGHQVGVGSRTVIGRAVVVSDRSLGSSGSGTD